MYVLRQTNMGELDVGLRRSGEIGRSVDVVLLLQGGEERAR